MKKTTFSIIVHNKAGALMRIVSLFARCNYNIVSLSVMPTDEGEHLSRIIMMAEGQDSKQMLKQICKLFNVESAQIVQ
jgi:acetolactate synthase small subunit